MNNKYIITAGAPLLRAGVTVTTEVDGEHLVQATRNLVFLVQKINDDKSSLEKLRALARNSEVLTCPTTVRIKPKHQAYDPFNKGVNEEMPMTERYHREVERRKACNRARYNNDPPRPRGAP